jgi:glycosyltransferase involved in cell wall biosynthesis
MRVLIVHNRYQAEGGEERAVAEIASLLSRAGHTVEALERSSAAVGRGRAARSLLSGGVEADAVESAARRLRADVVHAHNVHPLFGWRALAAARSYGARTVLHLHNFRLFCAVGIAYRDGRPCFDCRGRNTLPGLLHGCRGSVAEGAVYGAGLCLQQPQLLRHADAMVALSEAQQARLVELGVPVDRLSVLSNFVADTGFADESWAQEGNYALVSGRLVEEKGFDVAIAAARAASVPLVIAGAGPDEPRLRSLAGAADVRFAGWLSGPELARLRSQAAAVLVPSRCEDVCPYSVLDALAAGVPVLVSDRGGLPELVGADGTLGAGDVGAWSTALRELWSDAGLRRERGERALARARERFGERRYLERLLAIYRGEWGRRASDNPNQTRRG